MVIGPDFVFVAVPRTASVLMAERFLPQFAGREFGRHHEVVIPAKDRKKFTFAVVRNPYDRMLSKYHFHRQKPGASHHDRANESTAAEMVDLFAGLDYRHRSMTEFLEGVNCNMILRWENLAEEIHGLPFVGRAQLPSKRINTVRRPHWTEEATPEFIAAVNQHSAPDFERYGYTKL